MCLINFFGHISINISCLNFIEEVLTEIYDDYKLFFKSKYSARYAPMNDLPSSDTAH